MGPRKMLLNILRLGSIRDWMQRPSVKIMPGIMKTANPVAQILVQVVRVVAVPIVLVDQGIPVAVLEETRMDQAEVQEVALVAPAVLVDLDQVEVQEVALVAPAVPVGQAEGQEVGLVTPAIPVDQAEDQEVAVVNKNLLSYSD